MLPTERVAVNLPLVGTVELPPPEHLAYYAGIGVLVALDVVEWPAALMLGLGHALITTQQRHPSLQKFLEALEDA